MITRRKFTGLAIATAAAGLFAIAAIPGTAVAAEDGKVHCTGINACKGKTDCKTATNACKGKGFISMSEKECKEKGGKSE